MRAQPEKVSPADRRRADLDAAAGWLDRKVWRGELAPGDRITRPASDATVLIADTLPAPDSEPRTTVVFLIGDGHLYHRRGRPAWTREID